MGDRSRIVSMLRYLVEERNRRGLTKPWVSISFVVQRGNCAEVARAAQEAVDIGLDCVLYMALGINEASREVVLSQRDEEETLRQMAQAQRVLSHAGRVTNAHHYLSRQRGVQWSRAILAQTPCYVGQFFCRSHTDGAVDPCGVSRRIVGDITRERIRDIWSSPLYRAFRQEASSLPQRGRPLDRCGCYTCNHAQTILSYHQRLSAGIYPEII
jgi:MoaA/NifB/PqqE/SkfB family radical SAM enzyme